MSDTDAESWFDSLQYDGALITESTGEDNYYEFNRQADDADVVCVGPTPGQYRRYTFEEFRAAVDSGHVTPATEDVSNERYETPNGPVKW
jgi:hypothetical protein